MSARPLAQTTPILIADIGGTNARFALVWEGSPELEILPTVPTRSYATACDAIRELVHGRAGVRPKAAVLAVAAPMGSESFQLTNGPWRFEPRKLLGELGLKDIIFLNDFEAQALALPRLSPPDLVAVGGGGLDSGATRLVIGPGTGLGAAALIQAGGWRPIGGEGGHIERAPLSAREREIWPYIAREGERVDAETILSGPGLVALYRAVIAADGTRPEFSSPREVLQAGLAGAKAARETLELFAVHLGRFAGDLALVFMARGGVYVSGGIGLKMASFLVGSGFREAFEDKPPYRELMRGIGVRVIVQPNAGLLGLAGLLQAPQDYAMPLAGRRWQA